MSGFRSIEKTLKSHASSIAIAVNMFSITVLMIALSFLGYLELAADVGLIQGAMLAVFLAFSANARNLILGAESSVHLKQQFIFRGILLLPLSLAAFYLSGEVAETSSLLAVALISRRSSEWIAELQISENEKSGDVSYARRFIIIQILSFSLLIFAFGIGNKYFYEFALFFWACSPVFQSIPFFVRMLSQFNSPAHINFRNFLPHLGSSWIIAVSVFVFRALLALMVEKSMAGILYSAFAIGGMLSAIYTYALGPSLISRQNNQQATSVDRLTIFTVAIHCLMGSALTVLAGMGVTGSGESAFFMQSIGFSVIGGGIMILAQHRRMHILQIQENNVFVPDVLANILIIATVPFAFFLLGSNVLTGLFLWNACLTYIIYTFSSFNEITPEKQSCHGKTSKVLRVLDPVKMQVGVLFCLLFPIFFQISGNFIFDDPSIIYNSEGILTKLPIPISVIGCFAGIGLLIRSDKTLLSGGTLFGLFIMMLLSTFMVSMESRSEQLGKFILLIQFILPVFGLLLGQSYIIPEVKNLRFETIFLYVLTIIIPLEVLATLMQGTGFLTPNLYVFSVYQHFQYLPEIFVGLYFLALISLFEYQYMRVLLLLLAPFVGIYTAASLSALAMGMLLAGSGCALFALIRKGYRNFSIMVVLLSFTSLLAYTVTVKPNDLFVYKFQNSMMKKGAPNTPRNLQERLPYWKLYWNGISKSPRKFMFGHERAPNRDVTPSAHNYYLDLVYNFGFISLLPFIYLIGHTLRKLYRMMRATTVPLDLLGLAALVLFFVLIDNSLKVGFRQPYSGIIVFFLWGVLLSRLNNPKNETDQIKAA